ncbi:CU044_5270 family protein [Actinomycetes bacterium KLBMP 9797]
MNDLSDLTAVERLGTALDPPTSAPPDELRRRLLSTVPEPRGSIVVRPRLGRRLAISGALAAVLGVAIAVPYAVGDRSPEMTPAAQVLHDAAAHAQRRPDVTPRPDQFIYVNTIGRERMIGTMRPFGSESWMSVDGTRGGMSNPGPGRAGTTWLDCTPGGDRKCHPMTVYRPDLPTDAGRMLDYLYRVAPTEALTFPFGPEEQPDRQAFAVASKIMNSEYVSPAAQRAIFEAIAEIPGVRLVGDVTDDAGRAGVAVALPDDDRYSRYELIFDRGTHEYLGSRVVMLKDGTGVRAGDVIYATAILKIAIVDRLGQTP